jgi:hypothetical protein
MLLLFVAVLVSFLAASVAANFAVIFTVVDEAITTTTTSSGLLEVKGSDTIAKTAVATQDVPLVVAPALDMDTLSNVRSLRVSYVSGDDVVQAQLSVVAVRKHNATFVEFVTDVGETVEVLNGVASLLRYAAPSPTDYGNPHIRSQSRICAANATCSAFRASGIDADAALDRARADLEAIGVEDAARRLSPGAANNPSCTSTQWTNNVAELITCAGSIDIASCYYIYDKAYSPGNRHVVFILHGTGMTGDDMWWVYCQTTTWSCPLLTVHHFKHLIFLFPTSAIISPLGNAWNAWPLDAFTYWRGADALASTMCSLNTAWPGYAWDTCTFPGEAFMSPYCGMGAGVGGCLPGVGSGAEMFMFGFSHGGGMAAYANYGYGRDGVTKAVAIDYHGWHNSAWITQHPEFTSPEYDASGSDHSNFALKAYYICDSPWYSTDQFTTGTTYSSSLAGVSPVQQGNGNPVVYSTLKYGPATTANPNGISFYGYTWDASDGRYMKFLVFGHTGWQDTPDENAGQTCSGDPDIGHSDVPYYVNLYAETCEWIGGCFPPSTPPPLCPLSAGQCCPNGYSCYAPAGARRAKCLRDNAMGPFAPSEHGLTQQAQRAFEPITMARGGIDIDASRIREHMWWGPTFVDPISCRIAHNPGLSAMRRELSRDSRRELKGKNDPCGKANHITWAESGHCVSDAKKSSKMESDPPLFNIEIPGWNATKNSTQAYSQIAQATEYFVEEYGYSDSGRAGAYATLTAKRANRNGFVYGPF